MFFMGGGGNDFQNYKEIIGAFLIVTTFIIFATDNGFSL